MEERMKRTIAIAVTLVIAAAPLTMTAYPAAAQDVNVTVNPGIAFGYSDGYWDQGHHWHAWQDRQQEEAWRHDNADHYYDHAHDQEANGGWRTDQWWGHR
jgi:hypothetical protein